jgi:hypothetical protein
VKESLGRREIGREKARPVEVEVDIGWTPDRE